MQALSHCPITGEAAKLERRIPTQEIIDGYMSNYNIDVSHLFEGMEHIGVFRSEKSNLTFFGPQSVAGDGPFYEHLQKYPWYYMDWKWEHQAAKDMFPLHAKDVAWPIAR